MAREPKKVDGRAKPGQRFGGRQKGALNKDTLDKEDRLKEAFEAAAALLGSDIDTMLPVDVMMFTMRCMAKAGWWNRAAELAKDAAPYIHPKLQAITQTNGNPDESKSDSELAEELDALRARQASAARTGALEESLPEGLSIVGGSGTDAVRGNPGEASQTTRH